MTLTILNQQLNIWNTNLEIKHSIVDKIYQLKEHDVGSKKSNRGGWQSTSFFYDSPEYQWLYNSIDLKNIQIDGIEYLIYNSWFNINSSGHSNKWHNHGHRPFVGVLYIDVPNNSGGIEFQINQDNFFHQPSTGEFLMFPGYLQHRVSENLSNKDRISLAINFKKM